MEPTKPIWVLRFTRSHMPSQAAIERCEHKLREWFDNGCNQPIVLDAGVELVDLNRKSIADQDLDEAIESVQRDVQALSEKLDAYLAARKEQDHAKADTGHSEPSRD